MFEFLFDSVTLFSGFSGQNLPRKIFQIVIVDFYLYSITFFFFMQAVVYFGQTYPLIFYMD